jgi:phosphoglucosamine mutase
VTVKFGTDGIRGVANSELTPELVVALGRAAGRVLSGHGQSFLVGRDTRVSGPLLQAALSAGLAAEGVDVWDVGVLPTPGVAALSADRRLPAAVISASHNPFPDNGIKLFAAGGLKLADEVEEHLEDHLSELVGGARHERAAQVDRQVPGTSAGEAAVPTGAAVGRLRVDDDGGRWYRDRLVGALDNRRLGGIRVAVDCANGAASTTAPDVLDRAGAEVVALLGADPDGTNINAGAGSTHPDVLQDAVVAHGADVGLAFDGDADRVIAVDETGRIVDGDQLIALFALDLRRRGRLADDTVVVTVMTNLGFRLAMRDAGVAVRETQVGDRYILEELDRGGWSLGGEQSGHIIFRNLATTGDGVLTGLFLLDLVVRCRRQLSGLASEVMTRVPQVLRNVRVVRRDGLDGADAVWAEVAAVEGELQGRGRVLLRPSGTEPLVRVMVEAPTEEEAASAAARLADVVSRCLGSSRRRRARRRRPRRRRRRGRRRSTRCPCRGPRRPPRRRGRRQR